MKKNPVFILKILITVILSVCSCTDFDRDSNDDALTTGSNNDALVFNPDAYTTLNITLDGAPMQVRLYQVVYVAKPIVMAAMQPPRGFRGGSEPTPMQDPYGYQSMYIYVPDNVINDTQTAIILHVGNAGWMTNVARTQVEEGGQYVSTDDRDNVGVALKAGYIIVSAGTRSRGALAADGSWPGKAPAVIVDAKAAIRYLRLNDAVMPGSAERIVITGTSGGGGLSVAVAASGNSPDYFPYLAEIGAAGIDENGKSILRDDIFATVAYCPITDLGHADIAYEWQYNAVRTAENNRRGEYTDQMQDASEALKTAYPEYLAGLGLKLEDGTPLTVDNMDGAIIAQVKKETEEAISEGVDIPAIGEDFVLKSRRGETILKNDWLLVENGEVKNIEYEKYLRFVTNATALKAIPAFDATASTGNLGVTGENTLFGPADVEYSNFIEYAWNNNEVKGDGSGSDDTGMDWASYIADPATILDEQIKMVSPMLYLNSNADSAPYWYIRHGMVDRDTSFAVEVALYYGILNDPSVKNLNFELAWLTGHAGNYDVQEAYTWVADMLARAGAPASASVR